MLFPVFVVKSQVLLNDFQNKFVGNYNRVIFLTVYCNFKRIE